ncbi:hypothetical protein AYO46_02690 [Betaproteobacteria bacterium SCGC AG-212-J23]|nr:hypothetical protein AYO46_02690 [Betaproteobacteria bacterium SCGC AG-212-J23]
MRSIAYGLVCAAAFAGPAAAFELEPSVNYWMSEGKTTWNHTAQSVAPTLGDPTSRLTYSGMKSSIVELGLTLRVEEWFGKATFGHGSIDSGNLQDEDFLRGQIKFSDTNSVIKGDELRYWILDVGRNVFRNRKFAVVALAGYGEYHEVIDAFGATNNLGGGAVLAPQSTRVITNDAKWSFFRMGATGKFRPVEPLTLAVEAAYLPIVDLSNEDSHYLRNDLGPVPNIHMSGTGNGYMAQIEVSYNVFKGAILSAGYRDWRFKADGKIRFGSSGQQLPLNNFETTRSGVRLGLSYRF